MTGIVYKKKSNLLKKLVRVYILVIIILIAFVGGFFLGGWQMSHMSPERVIQEIIYQAPQNLTDDTINFNLYWDVWNSVKDRYYAFGDVSEKDMYYWSIKGIVASLSDPYSTFMDPTTTESFNKEMSGSFEGIGAEIGIKNEKLVIIAPLPNSPAAQAGLLPKDQIVAIDEMSATDITLDYAVSLIRGEKGTPVVLTILREGKNESQEITIVRDNIKIVTVEWEIKKTLDEKKDIGYIKISHFSNDTEGNFKKVINEILINEPAGIILDLRNNPGGYLDTAIKVASEFIEDGPVLIEKFRDEEKEEYEAVGNASLKGIPTVILVNGGSASASEIIAGAMQDYELATIVGETTFGKGSVQDLEEYIDGSSLKLTIAQWSTPNGRTIEGEGIKPDIEIELTVDDYNNDLDPQLDKAIELLSD